MSHTVDMQVTLSWMQHLSKGKEPMTSESFPAPSKPQSDCLEHLRTQGFAVVEGILSPEEVAEYTDLSYAEYRNSGKRVGLERLHSLTYYQSHSRFLDLLECKPMLDIVRQVLSDNICIYHTHLDVHPPNSVPSYYWHQDVDLISRDCTRLDAPLFLKVGYYLTDVLTEKHGATRVQPATHASRAYDPENAGAPLLLKAGSAVIFDHRLWHTRGLNTAPTDRLAIFVAYAYRWIRRRDEISELPEPGPDLGAALRPLLTALPPER
jgi:ectoine hydroxylase